MRWIESMQQEKSPAMSQKIGSTCLEITAAAAAAAAAERHTRAFLERVASPWRSTSCFHMHVQAHLSLSRKSALSHGVAGNAEATHLHLREHMCFKLSVRHVYFPSSPQVPGAQLCRHTTIPAMPAEHSHRGRAAQWAVWESEVATEAGGWERFKGSVCVHEAWGMQISVNAAVFNGTVSFFSKRNLRHQF